MNRLRSVLQLSALLFLVSLLSSCAMGIQLKTERADPKGIQGTYDLITYGCRYPSDIEHAAFLITPERTDSVDLFVLDTAYKIKRGLPANQALAEAETHVLCGIRTVQDIRIRRIQDGSGGTLGYEVLPRYPATDETGMDPLLVNYSLKNGKITIYIQFDPNVEKKINSMNTPGAGAM